MQDEAVEVNQSLYDRLAIIKQRMGELEGQRGKLLDLNLDGDFQKELLLEHKTRLEETLEKLEREYHDVNAHIQKVVLSGVHIAEIDTFCASTREKLDNTNFEQIRHVIGLLDLHGKLAIENDEKVVYIKCLVGQQRLSVARTSPL